MLETQEGTCAQSWEAAHSCQVCTRACTHTRAHVYKAVCACMCLYVPVSVSMWNTIVHMHVCVCIPLLCAGGA